MVGQSLVIPTPGLIQYTIKVGDTLPAIAQQYGGHSASYFTNKQPYDLLADLYRANLAYS
ncbi:hypothetical protein GCM10020331_074310 [Ectobacillus funiculus]